MDSLGNPTEDNNRNFARGSLADIFFNIESVSPTEASNQKISRGSSDIAYLSSTRLTPESESYFISAAKNKALPEGGQQLDHNNATDQDRVLICSRVGYRTQ